MTQSELPTWLLVFPALLGLACGSFLNVCIVRLPRGGSVVRPGSRCPQCGVALRPWQNIPIVSWLLLRGRCRACGKAIPIFYPLIELAVAVWFTVCTFQFFAGNTSITVALGNALLGWLLLGLMVMDAQTGLLPDAFTLGGTMMGLILLGARVFSLPADPGTVYFTTPEKLVMHRALAVIVAAGSLLLVRWIYRLLRHREGMGMGDVKMTAMLAAFLGLRLTTLAFLAACIVGSLYAAFTLARGRKNAGGRWAAEKGRPRAVPLGTFLAIGGWYALIAGDATLRWYLGFF
jgi:leader peptidase (prepilin peptidase)/N-methyltransferase